MTGADMISCRDNHFFKRCNLMYDCINLFFSSKNLNNVVYIRVVFQAPEGHVIIVKLHNDIEISMFLRLYL